MIVRSALLLFVLCLMSCDPQDLFSSDPVEEPTISDPVMSDAQIDAQLAIFVDNFEREANARGFNIDVAALGVTVELADVEGDNVAGVCYYHSQLPGRIEIDAPFFARMSDLQREHVVFHELGHCVLGRGHTEAQYQNGVCQSIMASGTGSCRTLYTEETRSIFIDELFDIQL